MLFVAFVEVVVVFGRVLLGAITFQNSFVPAPFLPRRTERTDLSSPQPPLAALLRPLPPPTILPLPAHAPGLLVGLGADRPRHGEPELSATGQERSQLCQGARESSHLAPRLSCLRSFTFTGWTRRLFVEVVWRTDERLPPQIIRYSESVISVQQPGAAGAGAAAAGGAEARRNR